MRWRRRKQPPPGGSSGQWIDPSKLLFSLPTICDELPAMSEEPAVPEDVFLHEDDWRQVELVAAGNEKAISENFAAIHQVRKEREGPGFEQIHVRADPRQPLIGVTLRRQELMSVIDSTYRDAPGVAFNADPRRIAGAFAYVGPSSTVYGVDRDGFLAVLAVHLTSASAGPDPGVAALRELAERHGAYVVDWLGAQSYPQLDGD